MRGLLLWARLGSLRDRADVLRLAVDDLRATTWQREREEPGVSRLHPPQAS